MSDANSDAMSRCLLGSVGSDRRMPPLPMMVIPTAMYIARSYRTSFVGVEPGQQRPMPPFSPLLVFRSQLGPRMVMENAHKVAQRLLSFLPKALLEWVCSRVLNLSTEITQETIVFLKSKRPAGGVPLLPGLLGIEGVNGANGESRLAVSPQVQESSPKESSRRVYRGPGLSWSRNPWSGFLSRKPACKEFRKIRIKSKNCGLIGSTVRRTHLLILRAEWILTC
jgi:hypothetical protein